MLQCIRLNEVNDMCNDLISNSYFLLVFTLTVLWIYCVIK